MCVSGPEHGHGHAHAGGGRHGKGQGEAGAKRGEWEGGRGVKGASLRHVDPTITHEKSPLVRAPPLLRLAVWPAWLGSYGVLTTQEIFDVYEKEKKVTSDTPEKKCADVCIFMLVPDVCLIILFSKMFSSAHMH